MNQVMQAQKTHHLVDDEVIWVRTATARSATPSGCVSG